MQKVNKFQEPELETKSFKDIDSDVNNLNDILRFEPTFPGNLRFS